MKVAVIISTYNKPDMLEKALTAWFRQIIIPDEIIIADDGSTDETTKLIKSYNSDIIKHVWHEDKGFRKTRILNLAIVSTDADYLVFTDQDCLPREDFLAVHLRYARQGHFLSGGYYKLTEDVSRKLTNDDIISGRAFEWKWLHKQGQPFSIKRLKLNRCNAFARFMNSVTPTKATWNGMNSSGWRKDIVATNGFDERMAWGGEDREMGERLINAGIKPVQIRYSAICLHLYHTRPYKNMEAIKQNDEIRKQTRKCHKTKTEHSLLANKIL